jgi:hypothetical protein
VLREHREIRVLRVTLEHKEVRALRERRERRVPSVRKA